MLPFLLHASPHDGLITTQNGKNKISIYQKLAWYKFAKKIDKNYSGNILLSKGCEKIILQNEEVLEINIIAISKDSVSFKKCNNLEDRSKTIPLADVLEIVALDGDLIFRGAYNKDYHIISTIALVFGLLGIIPYFGAAFPLIAIILGLVAKRRLIDGPVDKRKTKRANAAIVLGVIGLAITTAIIFIVINSCC